MKNFIVSFLLLLVLAYVLQMFLPWWSILPLAFIIGYAVKQSGWSAFLSAFVAIALLWGGYAWLLSSANEHLLAGKMAQLLAPLTGGKSGMLFLLTALVGGLVTGFAALAGSLAARLKA